MSIRDPSAEDADLADDSAEEGGAREEQLERQRDLEETELPCLIRDLQNVSMITLPRTGSSTARGRRKS